MITSPVAGVAPTGWIGIPSAVSKGERTTPIGVKTKLWLVMGCLSPNTMPRRLQARRHPASAAPTRRCRAAAGGPPITALGKIPRMG